MWNPVTRDQQSVCKDQSQFDLVQLEISIFTINDSEGLSSSKGCHNPTVITYTAQIITIYIYFNLEFI